jgi:hypothetical protein
MEMILGDGAPPLFELVAAAIRSRGDAPKALQVEIEDSKANGSGASPDRLDRSGQQ